MKVIGQFNGCILVVPTSGGKAGKGHNKTGSVQVRRGDMILKQFRFTIEPNNFLKAALKAKEFALNLPQKHLTLAI